MHNGTFILLLCRSKWLGVMEESEEMELVVVVLVVVVLAARAPMQCTILQLLYAN